MKCNSTKGVIWFSWGCHHCLATRTPASIPNPTLSRSTVWHIVEHSPKLRTLCGIGAITTECLEEKHYQMCRLQQENLKWLWFVHTKIVCSLIIFSHQKHRKNLHLGQSVLAARGTTAQVVFCDHTPDQKNEGEITFITWNLLPSSSCIFHLPSKPLSYHNSHKYLLPCPPPRVLHAVLEPGILV